MFAAHVVPAGGKLGHLLSCCLLGVWGFKPLVCLLGMGLTSHVHLQPLNGLPLPLDGVQPHIQVNSSWGTCKATQIKDAGVDGSTALSDG
ncbi:unnamed protein product [Caretta caretta]